MKNEYHILNLGAGVQSTTLYLMFMRGEIKPQIDCAIFADTQGEPEAVYRHLLWLVSLEGPPIEVRTRGCLHTDLLRRDMGDGRFATIPAFTQNGGRIGRQCSAEYKTEVIEKAIRQDVVGLRKRQRFPKGVKIHQYMGISLDEAGRAARITKRMGETAHWAVPHFPLIEQFRTRPECLTYMSDKVPHQCPRSACWFCPNHDDPAWFQMRETQPEEFARAVDFDRQIREPGRMIQRGLSEPLYLHRSRKPLDEVVFDTRPKPRDLQLSMSFAAVCEGVCGV